MGRCEGQGKGCGDEEGGTAQLSNFKPSLRGRSGIILAFAFWSYKIKRKSARWPPSCGPVISTASSGLAERHDVTPSRQQRRPRLSNPTQPRHPNIGTRVKKYLLRTPGSRSTRLHRRRPRATYTRQSSSSAGVGPKSSSTWYGEGPASGTNDQRSDGGSGRA